MPRDKPLEKRIAQCPHGKKAIITRQLMGIRRYYLTESACSVCNWTSQRFVGDVFRAGKRIETEEGRAP